MLLKSQEKMLTELLNIPDVKVINQQKIEDFGIVLTIESLLDEAVCPHCGHKSSKLHQNHYHLIRDLPWNDQDVYLKINRRQFKCQHCNKKFSETLEYVEKRRTWTQRYATSILEQVIEGDILSVSERTNLSEDQIQRILNDAGEALKGRKPVGIKYLGIDEIAAKKGHKSYYAVLVDLETRKPITLVPGRTKEEVGKVLRSWGSEVLEGIEKVTMDLWSPYKSLVEEMMPKAEIVADRFHVMKLINGELDGARKEEAKAAKKAEGKSNKEEEKEVKKMQEIYRKSKYSLLRNEKEITNETMQERLEIVKSISPRLEIMHRLKEEFRDIFEKADNSEDGTSRLKDWLNRASKYYVKSCETVSKWFKEIIAYFGCKLSNGIVEGINNKIKLIKRSGFGFRNFNNFNIRVLLSW